VAAVQAQRTGEAGRCVAAAARHWVGGSVAAQTQSGGVGGDAGAGGVGPGAVDEQAAAAAGPHLALVDGAAAGVDINRAPRTLRRDRAQVDNLGHAAAAPPVAVADDRAVIRALVGPAAADGHARTDGERGVVLADDQAAAEGVVEHYPAR